jgi:hypothetical protein
VEERPEGAQVGDPAAAVEGPLAAGADPMAAVDATEQIVRDLRSVHEAAHGLMNEMAGTIGDLERRAALFEIFMPYLLESGAKTWSEVFDRLSDDDWQEVARILNGRNLAGVLMPPEPATEQPRVRRRRVAGKAHVDRLTTGTAPAAREEQTQPEDLRVTVPRRRRRGRST